MLTKDTPSIEVLVADTPSSSSELNTQEPVNYEVLIKGHCVTLTEEISREVIKFPDGIPKGVIPEYIMEQYNLPRKLTKMPKRKRKRAKHQALSGKKPATDSEMHGVVVVSDNDDCVELLSSDEDDCQLIEGTRMKPFASISLLRHPRENMMNISESLSSAVVLIRDTDESTLSKSTSSNTTTRASVDATQDNSIDVEISLQEGVVDGISDAKTKENDSLPMQIDLTNPNDVKQQSENSGQLNNEVQQVDLTEGKGGSVVNSLEQAGNLTSSEENVREVHLTQTELTVNTKQNDVIDNPKVDLNQSTILIDHGGKPVAADIDVRRTIAVRSDLGRINDKQNVGTNEQSSPVTLENAINLPDGEINSAVSTISDCPSKQLSGSHIDGGTVQSSSHSDGVRFWESSEINKNTTELENSKQNTAVVNEGTSLTKNNSKLENVFKPETVRLVANQTSKDKDQVIKDDPNRGEVEQDNQDQLEGNQGQLVTSNDLSNDSTVSSIGGNAKTLVDEDDGGGLHQCSVQYRFDGSSIQVAHCTREYSGWQENYLRGCNWSPDGKLIVTNSNDNILRTFALPDDILNGEESIELVALSRMREGEMIYSTHWYPFMNGPNSCLLLSTCRDHPIHLWDVTSSTVISSYSAYDQMDELSSALSVSFNTDGSKIYAGFNKSFRIFDSSRPGRECAEVSTVCKKGASRKKGRKPSQQQPGIVSSFAFPCQYYGYYAVGSFGKTIGLYDTRTDGVVDLLACHHGGITQVQFTYDGCYLLSGGRKEDNIFCWDMRNTLSPVFKLARDVSTNQRIQFDIDRSDSYVVTGTSLSSFHMYNLHDVFDHLNADVYKPTHTYTGHRDAVNSVSLHPTLPLLASTSGQRHFYVDDEDSDSDEKMRRVFDNSLRIWRV